VRKQLQFTVAQTDGRSPAQHRYRGGNRTAASYFRLGSAGRFQIERPGKSMGNQRRFESDDRAPLAQGFKHFVPNIQVRGNHGYSRVAFRRPSCVAINPAIYEY
jgi:hypothetical protein